MHDQTARQIPAYELNGESETGVVHEPFDITKFKRMFPLSDLRKAAREYVLDLRRKQPDFHEDEDDVERHVRLMEPSGRQITSPFDIAVVEQLREEAGAELHEVEKLPTDVFVYARGVKPSLGDDPERDRRLMWGDAGSVYFFLDGDRVHWTVQCY